MSEVTTQIVDTEIKYKNEWNGTIAGDITKYWDNWDSDRLVQLTWIKKIEELLDLIETLKKDKDGNIKLKDVGVRRIYRTMVARLYNSTFKTPAQMFNVDLETETQESIRYGFCYKQKQALLNVLKKAKTKQECLEGIKNLFKKGENILFVNWYQDFELVRRKEGFKLDFMGVNVDLQKYVIKRQLKYDGVKIKNIDPENFVYDTKRGDFNAALKIGRTWATYNDIANNETYKKFLSKDNLQMLQDKSNNKKNSSQSDIQGDRILNTYKGYDNEMIEILEGYGDYTLEYDGKTQFFPNMKITIIGREFVGCFEYNPYIINPYIIHLIEKDPKTGRGIPVIAGIIANSIGITDILNKYNKALGLAIYQCFIAPKGSFSGKIEVTEGGVIEYTDKLGDVNKLIPLDFRGALQGAIQGIEFYKQEQQEETQVYRQSAGDSVQQPQTLGQAKLLQQNQDIIESCDDDLYNDNIVIGLIERIASMMANFKDQPETIKYRGKNNVELVDVIDDTVRQANFVYTIGDSSTSIQKKMTITEYIDKIMGQIAPYMAQTGQGTINATELINKIGSAYEEDNPTSIIISPSPQPSMGVDINGQPTTGNINTIPVNPNEQLQNPEAEIL